MPALSVDAALSRIVGTVSPRPAIRVPLLQALGRILAADIISSIDSPPFDKALMDGYAVRSADLPQGRGRLEVIEEIVAGQVPTRSLSPGVAIQIMTGAPLPAGCDAVVQSEHTQRHGATVEIATRPVHPGMNMIARAATLRSGDLVLSAGTVLHPARLAGLAEVGVSEVPVYPQPRVAVLATGDELVDVDSTPGPGQIRNTNETLLVALMRQAGCHVTAIPRSRDVREELARKIREGLAADILLLTGGVSAGKLDLVPSELAAAGVTQVFHGVDLKPGKPIWFGTTAERAAIPPTCVFGLPGNPVSSLVCAELFVLTAVRRLQGHPQPIPQPVTARLGSAHTLKGDRPTYHPARLTWSKDGPPVATTVTWQGSSDLQATLSANAMIYFPVGQGQFDTGTTVMAYPWHAPEGLPIDD